mgnify:CR=1 FL=1
MYSSNRNIHAQYEVTLINSVGYVIAKTLVHSDNDDVAIRAGQELLGKYQKATDFLIERI